MRGRSRQRQVILEELRKLTTHPRSDELYGVVRGRLPRVSLATIYRNLGQLNAEGLALEIYCGDFVRYDGNVSPHDHLLCRGCRRVWDLDGGSLEPRQPVLGGGKAHFVIEGCYTVHFGLCEDCRRPADGAARVAVSSGGTPETAPSPSANGRRTSLGGPISLRQGGNPC